jgi:hypothetical protein
MNKKVCGERPPYSQGGKSYPTCGLTCAGILANHPSRSLGGQNHGGYAAEASTRSGSRRGSVPITSNPSTLRNISAQSSQISPTPLVRSRSQHFNTPQRAAPIARSRSRYFKTPPPPYSPLPPSRTLSQLGGYTPQQNANQHMPLPPSRTLSQRSGGGGHIVQRNPSQGGAVSQTQGRGSRYAALLSSPLPCVVGVPLLVSFDILILYRCAW